MQAALLISLILSIFLPSAIAADLNPLLEHSSKYENIKVIRVLSVDTMLLENDEKIVLIGIKGLRPPKREDVKRDEYGRVIPVDDPTTPLEEEAFRFAKNMVEGKPVRLEFDMQRRDDDGILTAYVFLSGDQMVNAEFLRQGYAELSLRAPNMKYAERLRKAYQEARREMRGLQGNW